MALSALWSHFGGHPKSVDLRHLACAQTGNASDRKKRAKPGPVAHNSPDLAAAIFGQKPRKRWISGIGSSICPPLLQHAIIDDIVIVREADTIAGCRELLDRHGLFVGGSTGTVYRAIQNYFCRSFTVRPRVLFSVLRSRHGVSA
jgi:cysteine synthase A